MTATLIRPIALGFAVLALLAEGREVDAITGSLKLL